MNVFEDFVALFYPRCCFACSEPLTRGEELICSHCLTRLPKTSYHRWQDNPVWGRMAGRLPVRFAFAFLKFMKGGIVQNLLHELKYNNRPEIGTAIGNLYGRALVTASISSYPYHSIAPACAREDTTKAQNLLKVFRKRWTCRGRTAFPFAFRQRRHKQKEDEQNAGKT